MLKYLNPIRPIRNSFKQGKSSFSVHRDNIQLIKSLWRQVYGGQPATFAEQVDRHDAKKVKIFCLLRKRACILVGGLFFFYGVQAVLSGNVFGWVTISTSVPLFYMLSLMTSYRLWQLEQHDYDAPINKYLKRKTSWWVDAINPHLFSRAGR